jgi:hypothetical protein
MVELALNVFPLLCPGLSNVYVKFSGPGKHPQTLIWVNNPVRDDLQWLLQHIVRSSGVHLPKFVSWPIEDVDTTIYCDTCMSGMGFWYPELGIGGYSPINFEPPMAFESTDTMIFFYKALCVVSAIHYLSEALLTSTAVIYTNNMNTVDIFNSLSALPAYNPILKSAIDCMLDYSYNVRVLHIEGSKNGIADALSRKTFSLVMTLAPNGAISIIPFLPPQDALGLTKS